MADQRNTPPRPDESDPHYVLHNQRLPSLTRP